MLKKGTKSYSVLRFKCPRCHEGDLYESRNPYNLRKIGKMHKDCPVCHQRYTPEPGFYFGAAYISYGLMVALGVAIYTTLAFLGVDDIIPIIATIVIVAVLFAPLNFCLSRAMWLGMFVRYDPEQRSKTKDST